MVKQVGLFSAQPLTKCRSLCKSMAEVSKLQVKSGKLPVFVNRVSLETAKLIHFKVTSMELQLQGQSEIVETETMATKP